MRNKACSSLIVRERGERCCVQMEGGRDCKLELLKMSCIVLRDADKLCWLPFLPGPAVPECQRRALTGCQLGAQDRHNPRGSRGRSTACWTHFQTSSCLTLNLVTDSPGKTALHSNKPCRYASFRLGVSEAKTEG